MKLKFLSLCLVFCSSFALAETFTVKDIRVEGLERISAGTVFGAFPINIGDNVDDRRLAEASKSLFKTGYFNDVSLQRDGNILIVNLVELPTITELTIEGNKAIETEQLKEGLKQAGLAEGYVFKRSTLERLDLELERQYVAQGRYDAHVETEVNKLPRNRVALKIKVDEGSVASIDYINIVGNQDFAKNILLKQFDLKPTNFWSWYKSDDKYAREKLSGDLERLRSFYLDRGYIRFNIESTQVSLSPKKDSVYVTVNVHEGSVYQVTKVDLAGELILEQSLLEKLIIMKAGETYSRGLVTMSQDLISKRLGNEGFTFASVNAVPKIDDEKKTVELTFYVEPGKRTYVRRINVTGNSSTMDEVVRREMRQMEGGWASTELIEQSKSRLEQLGYFKGVNVETPKVPGTDDMIDVNYGVEEQPSGSLNLSIGYSSSQGMILGSSVSQNNFLGTGKKVSASVNKTSAQTSLNFSHTDPYYTVDGVSRGYNLFYRETDFSQLYSSDYNTDTYGGSTKFGFPINNRERLTFSVEASKTMMETRESGIPEEILEFVDAEGTEFNEFTLQSQWTWSTLNRGVFPTAGAKQELTLESTVPTSELEYFRMTYEAQIYFPIHNEWSLRLRGNVGYGDGYGATDSLPFFRNFRAGGMGSVRGYTRNTLGAKGALKYYPYTIDTDGNLVYSDVNQDGTVDEQDYQWISDSSSMGGNLLTEANMELAFPLPLIEDQRSIRSVIFLDAGNVFTTKCLVLEADADGNTTHPGCVSGFDSSEIRMGAGVGLTWITAIGPLTFTFSRALNAKGDDQTEGFEFSLGQVF